MSLSVALVCPYSMDHPGGVATHVLGLAGWLRGRGHTVLVIAPGSGESTDELQLLGASMSLPFNGSVAHLGLRPDQAMKARSLLVEADIVHVHEPLTPGLAYATARAGRGRLVVTHHAQYRPGLLTWPLRLRSALLPPRVSIAVSPAAAETARVVTGAEATVVPNAVAMPPAPEGEREANLVVFLGRRDEPRKGYAIFEAMAEQMPEARFVAIGPGGGAQGRVEQVGALNDAERDGWLARASVLVAPNRFGESFGIVLIEALARGCAVVASDLPAFRAVIDDPAVASFFPVADVAAAVTALKRRLTAPVDARQAWRSAGRFSWDSVGPGIETAYSEALLLGQ